MKRIIIISSLLICLNTYGQSCQDITVEYDKFTGITTFSSPELKTGEFSLNNRSVLSVYVIKKVSSGGLSYYLSMIHTNQALDLSGHGAIIILDDGARINKPEVNYSFQGGSERVFCIYLSLLKLEENELSLLINHKITDIRLFAYESTHHDDFSLSISLMNIPEKITF